MQWIGRAWRGEEKLWIVFWIYGVLVNIVGSILLVLFFLATGVHTAPHIGAGVLAAMLVQIVYTTWIMGAHWRCAFNVRWCFWGYAVRVSMVVGFVVFDIVLLTHHGIFKPLMALF